MSEPKFTKGEWRLNFTGPHWNNPELMNIEICFNDSGECICDTVYEVADAHLIKTAPKMYAMLESIAEEWERNGSENNPILPLLAEARGEK